jgi:hypothetical protein
MIIPGIIPAINRSPTEHPAVEANTIIVILGGIIIAKEEAEQTVPAAKCFGYPFFSNMGYVIPPIAQTVAGDDPDSAPKTRHATTVAVAVPP